MSAETQVEWAFVFPTEADHADALSILRACRVSFRTSRRPDRYPLYLLIASESKADICHRLGTAGVLLSGYYEVLQPSAPQAPLPRTKPSAPDDLLRGAVIVYVAECVADPSRIRLIARFSEDVREVLPYLNALMKNATYTPGGPHLTFSKGMRMITLYPDKVAVAKADDIDDGWAAVNWVRNLVNDTWRRRAAITPCAERRVRATALEIFGWLPRTNCRRCGEWTCLAFAAKLLIGEQTLSHCTPLSEPVNERKRTVLAEMLGVV